MAAHQLPPWSSLPFDLVALVLSKLPLESLLRFRSACKQWCSLTYDPYFIRTHLRSSRSTRSILIVDNETSHDSTQSLTNFTLDGKVDELPIVDIAGNFDYLSHLSNSTNGLVGVIGHRGLFLLNPFTHESNVLPKFDEKVSFQFFALGYDESTDVYKMLAQVVYGDDDDDDDDDEVDAPAFDWAVLTVGSNQWRARKDPYYGFKYDRPVSIQGALYFLATSGWSNEGIIVSFTIKDEKFRTIPLPLKRYAYRYGLTVYSCKEDLEEHLCYMCRGQCSFDRNILDLWTLKVDTTWVYEYSIDLLLINKRMLPTDVSIIDFVDGYILIHIWGKHLLCYDVKTNTSVSFPYRYYRPSNIIYTPSLISPKIGLVESLHS